MRSSGSLTEPIELGVNTVFAALFEFFCDTCIQFYIAVSQLAEIYVATSLLSLVGYKSCYCQRFLHIYHYHDQAMSHIV